MSTTTIAQRPISKATAAVAVLAALAIGGLSLVQSNSDEGAPSAPAKSPQQTVQQPSTHHHFVTSSGGRVMLGE